MALITSKHTRRITPPHETESWFDVRPIRAGDFESLRANGSEVAISLDLLVSLITAWSYAEPVDRDNVANLDLDTFAWLSKEIMTLSGVRDDDEKKESGSPSLRPTLPPSLDSSVSPASSAA